jgi:hypothetical protein
MSDFSSKLRRHSILIFGLVLVITPFFLYYLYYVSNQTAYFTSRDLRTLAALSNHVEEKVESQSNVFKNAVQNYLELNATSKECLDCKINKNPEAFKRDFQSNMLDVFKGDGTYLTVTNIDVLANPSDESSLTLNPEIAIRLEDGQRWLYLRYVVRFTPKSSEISDLEVSEQTEVISDLEIVEQTGGQEAKQANRAAIFIFQAKTNLDGLIGPLVDKREVESNKGSDHQYGFDAILIADVEDRVEVIFQQSSSELRVASLNNLMLAGGEEKKVDLNEISQSTNLTNVRFAGADYKLFVQPVQLPLSRIGAENKHGTRWLACGLIQSSHFRAETWSVSYTVLIVFGFITALVALSWPLLKLIFAGPKDRFRPVDAYLLVLSTLIITAFLTFFLLFTYNYSGIEADLDRQLKSFAGDIHKNFNAELDVALQQLDELNRNPALQETLKELEVLDGSDDKYNVDSKRKAEFNIKFLTKRDSQNILDGPLKGRNNPYPYFLSAFWADPKGAQRIKWTVRKDVTRRINVSDRPYFYNIRQGYNQKLGTHEFWLQPILSKTTGGNEVIITKPVTPFAGQPNWVSAIDTRLLSLMQSVVPTSFGFAVIDNDGKVLFHSDEKQHLGENFFEECDNNNALRAAVMGRNGELINAQYLGKGHRLYVEPLRTSSWTLIVFRDKDYLRTAFSEILTLSLILFLSYFLLLMILFGLAYLINRKTRDHSAWLWPAEAKRELYCKCVIINLILCALSCLSLYLFSGWQMILVPVLFSLIGCCLCILNLKWGTGFKLLSGRVQRLRVFNYRRAYISNAVLLFILIGILPAWACFQLSFHEEMRLFVKEGQLNLAKSLAEREDRVRAQYSDANMKAEDPASVEQVVARRLKDDNLDVYGSFFFNTRIEALPSTHEGYEKEYENGLTSFFGSYVPLFNQNSIERHALNHARTLDDSWYWEEYSQDKQDKLVLHTNAALSSTQKNSQRHIISTITRVPRSIWWWLMWGLLIFITSLLTSFMIRRMFLLHLTESSLRNLDDYYGDNISRNMFVVLGPPFTGKAELLKRLLARMKKPAKIDVQEKAIAEKWAEQDGLVDKDSYPIVLDNFEYEVDNPTINQQKLFLLEKLNQEQKIAVALSALNPESYSFSNDKEDEHREPHLASIAGERWAGILSRFLKINLEDIGDSERFRAHLAQKKSGLNLSEGDQERMKTVFKIVERECMHRACLQNIGIEIINQQQIKRLSPSLVIKQILAQAMTYYEALWRACTDNEKLTLSHLAKDRLLSPNDPDTDGLFMRGLIIRDPDVRLMNETFRMFVIKRGQGKAMKDCEEQARGTSSWEMFKVPFAVILTSIIIFLFITQRDLYNSALAIITALTAGMPSLFKILSPSQRDTHVRPTHG